MYLKFWELGSKHSCCEQKQQRAASWKRCQVPRYHLVHCYGFIGALYTSYGIMQKDQRELAIKTHSYTIAYLNAQCRHRLASLAFNCHAPVEYNIVWTVKRKQVWVGICRVSTRFLYSGWLASIKRNGLLHTSTGSTRSGVWVRGLPGLEACLLTLALCCWEASLPRYCSFSSSKGLRPAGVVVTKRKHCKRSFLRSCAWVAGEDVWRNPIYLFEMSGLESCKKTCTTGFKEICEA